LRVRHLKTWFPIKRGIWARTVKFIRAVDDVSLEVSAGETVGLVGESGCGKTTLGRSLAGLETITAGEIEFDGRNITVLSARQRQAYGRRMQMIFQDPYSSLNPRLSALDIITEGMLVHRLIRAAEKESAALRLLQDVGLDAGVLHRYPHEFSGGQRQRLSIARALSLRPELVICDEALSALDISVRAQVLNLLLDLRERHGLAYLFISHDLSVVRHIADRVAVMYLGQIVETGPCRDVLERPAHPYTRALIAAVPRPLRARRRRLVLAGEVPSPSNPPPGCRFHTRCAWAGDACRRIPPELAPLRAERAAARQVACLRKDELPPFAAED
jgi:oligopeptide/dipeptide ABC transporter ATP-binding protein